MKYVLAAIVFIAFAAAALAAARSRRTALAIGIAVTAILGLTLRPLGDDSQIHPWPFTDIVDALSSVTEAVPLLANLALFAPLGAVLAIGRRRLAPAVAFGFALALTIELVQLAVPGRTTSADDVLLNTAGTALGYLAVTLVR